MNANPVNIGTRLASMVLDHFIMSLIMVVPITIFTLATGTPFTTTKQPTTPAEMLGTGPMLYVMLVGLSIYLCKDCIGSRSIAKRIIKHQVVDNKTNAPATPLQCLLRNFSVVFWPIEIFFVLISPERRLGDRVAGTRVVPFDRSNKAASTTNYLQVALCLLIGFAYLFLLTKPLQ